MVSSCGFHLRGTGERAALLPPLYIEGGGAPHEPLLREMRRALQSQRTPMVSQRDAAHLIVQLQNEQLSKSVLAVDTSGKIKENELKYTLTFTVSTSAGEIALPRQSIERRYALSFNTADVLAKEAEEALLYQTMREDAIRDLLRRLETIK